MKNTQLRKKIKNIISERFNGEDFELEDRKQQYGIHPEIEDDYLEADDYEDEEINPILEKKKKEDEETEEELPSLDDEELPPLDDEELPPLDDEEAAYTPSSEGNDEIQNHLESALELAREIGDKKLVDQIGNTITFFTRAHIVARDKEVALDEIKYFQKIAGIIK